MKNKNPQRRSLFAWCLYDWANSAYFTIIMTFIFSAYFTEQVAANRIIGTAQWGNAVAISGLLIALLSPALGAIADQAGQQKKWLASFTGIAVLAIAMLGWIQPAPAFVFFALAGVVVATVAVEVAIVFYNAMLRTLVPKSQIGRISGWAWGVGYAGGLVSLLICLYGITQNLFPIRAIAPFVAVWFLLFSLPLFFWIPEQSSQKQTPGPAVRKGLTALWKTLCQFHRYREIAKFLLARVFYIDGLNTLFAFGGIFAAGTFGLTLPEVIQFGMGMNIAAGIGAASFAVLDDKLGSKKIILLALIGIIVCAATILLTDSKTLFWVVGMLLSLFIGPAQAASRSLMVHMVPEKRASEMFGFYALSGKITAFIGPWLFGLATIYYGSQRAGMVVVITFLLIGAAILHWVRPDGDKNS